jgi:hypothetical protein
VTDSHIRRAAARHGRLSHGSQAESSHNGQSRLCERVDPEYTGDDRIQPDDPTYPQARLFAINTFFEDKLGSPGAYKEQPLEAHAFRAGMDWVRALMPALQDFSTCAAGMR